jgi:hypothetical protein
LTPRKCSSYIPRILAESTAVRLLVAEKYSQMQSVGQSGAPAAAHGVLPCRWSFLPVLISKTGRRAAMGGDYDTFCTSEDQLHQVIGRRSS